MKLYKFDYEGFGNYYIVMAESPEKALRAVKDCCGKSEFSFVREAWKDATLGNLPKGYTLKVFDKGEVIEGEYS